MATGWVSSLAPPPGEQSNFVNPVNQMSANIALHAVCLTLATAAVCMRLRTRSFILRMSLSVDDYFCIASYCFTVVFSAMMIKSYTWGVGRHLWDEPLQWLPSALKYFTIAQYFFVALTGTVKLSFLFFYHRLFSPHIRINHFITGGIIFVAVSSTTVFFLTIFDCKPVSHAWDELSPGKCWNPVILPYISGALSVSTDIYVLILPMKPLWGLQMTFHKKLRLLAVFGLGIFTCVTSIVRLGETHILTSSPDATWNISKIAIWAMTLLCRRSTIEGNIGIVVSCLQLLPKFLEHQFSEGFLSSLSHIWSSRNTQTRSSKHTDRSSTVAFPLPSRKLWEGPHSQTYIEMLSQEDLHEENVV